MRRRQKPSGSRTAKTHNCSWAGQGSSCPGAFGSLRQHFIASSRLGATLAVQNLSAETVRTVQHTKPSNNQPKAGGAFIIGFDRGIPAPSSLVYIYINPLSTALQIQLSNRSGAFSWYLDTSDFPRVASCWGAQITHSLTHSLQLVPIDLSSLCISACTHTSRLQ